MLVVIDPNVTDALLLAAGVLQGAEVLILDPNRDGIEQITQALQERTNLSSLHLVAHGTPGCLQLGSTQLSLDTLERYVSQLQTWSNSISGASLLLYGCRVALGESGRRFIELLHQLTGANIAASTERVGNAAQGGSWALGSRIGQMFSGLAFAPEVMQAYSGVFASDYNEAVDGDISGDPSAPVSLQLAEGVNSLTATSVAGDVEYVTVTVPEGFQLDSLVLASYDSTDGIAFAAVQSGSVFTEPTQGTDVGNLLGYSHFGPSLGQVGTDILDDLGNSGGAIGFTAPLASDDYTFWLQQTGPFSTTYTLEFNVSATDEPVELVGGDGNDVLEGFGSDDTIAGGLGSDEISGNGGNDVLRGDLNSRSPGGTVGGDDIIYGGAGNDRIGGKAGNDTLYGSSGDDRIWGDDGNDVIYGGLGNNILDGDASSVGIVGRDTFVLAAGEGTNTILDFQVEADLIGLAADLTFGQLTITQDGNNALIRFEDETLAIINQVQVTALTSDLFTPVV